MKEHKKTMYSAENPYKDNIELKIERSEETIPDNETLIVITNEVDELPNKS